MARGFTYKRCKNHGVTGTPARGAKPSVPACKCRDGRWTWRAEGVVDTTTGKRTRPSRGGFLTRDEAQDALSNYLAETGGGKRRYDRRMTVGQWLDRWLERCEEAVRNKDLELKTLVGYRGHVKLLKPFVGDVRLRDLERHHVETALSTLRRPVEPTTGEDRKGRGSKFTGQRSARTIDGIRRTLRAALNDARNERLIVENPAAGDLDAIGKAGEKSTTWWEPDQLAAFLEHVRGDALESLWVVAAFTGLRRAELCGLTWDAVDLEAEKAGLWVSQRVSGVNGKHRCPVCGGEHTGRLILRGAKSSAGVRRVPLAAPAVVALKAHRTDQAALREHLGDGWSDHGLVWTADDEPGAPLRPGMVTARHADLVASSGQPRVRLHDMRHGAASMMIASGMPIELVAKVLGHASPAVTREVYLHGLWDSLADGMDAAAALVKPRS